MALDKTELLVGVATVKIGTTVVGYTRDGVTITPTTTRTDINADQVNSPLYRDITEQSATIAFNMLQMDLATYKTLKLVDSAGKWGLSAGAAETEQAVEVYGTKKDATLVKYTFHKCVLNLGAIATVKGDAATTSLEILANYDDATNYCVFTMSET